MTAAVISWAPPRAVPRRRARLGKLRINWGFAVFLLGNAAIWAAITWAIVLVAR
jgi:hypothetical protein